MEKYTIYEMKKTEYGILAYLQNVKASKIGGRKTVFTAWNGSEDEIKASMQSQEEFELDEKFIVDGTPYVSKKSGKTIVPKWYRVV